MFLFFTFYIEMLVCIKVVPENGCCVLMCLNLLRAVSTKICSLLIIVGSVYAPLQFPDHFIIIIIIFVYFSAPNG